MVICMRLLRPECRQPNRGAAVNRRPAGQADGSDNLSATLAADRAFPAAVAELGRRLASHELRSHQVSSRVGGILRFP